MNAVRTTDTILDQIIARKQQRLAQRKKNQPFEQLERQLEQLNSKPADFAQALQVKGSLAIIGEIKKASPSKGLIQPDFNPARQAYAYAAAGVHAISVLTEEDYFLGSDVFLREAASRTSLPILRKDFLFDPYQIVEARILGASAVLLICAVLDSGQLRDLLKLTRSLDMQALVEVHRLDELMQALDCGADLIGINNRDLHTFQVDLSITEKLAGIIPAGKTVVSESGIASSRDMARIYRAGAHAVLVGETLMRTAGYKAYLTKK